MVLSPTMWDKILFGKKKTSSWLKKMWVWLKNYWYIPVIFIAMGLFMVLQQNDIVDDLSKILRAAKKRKDDEIKVIEKSHEEYVREADKNILRYQKTLTNLEHKYKRRRERLKNMQKKKIKKMVEETNKNPEELAKEAAKEFGWDYTE